MKVRIHELAAKEFDEAIEWYELRSEGLGERFKEATLRQIEKVKRNPMWFLVEEGDIYKAYVPKFDDFVKSPSGVLRFILRHCGARLSAPHSSGFARLPSGAFYCVV